MKRPPSDQDLDKFIVWRHRKEIGSALLEQFGSRSESAPPNGNVWVYWDTVTPQGLQVVVGSGEDKRQEFVPWSFLAPIINAAEDRSFPSRPPSSKSRQSSGTSGRLTVRT